MSISNDSPIEKPSDDTLGLDPFSQAVARSILGMAAPQGVVLAISGQWGAGKSSAVNLVKHHLNSEVKSGSIEIVTFNPWWFAGADALTLSFFQELDAAIGPSLPERFRKSIAWLGQGVSAVGAFSGAVTGLAAPGIGVVIAKGAELAGTVTKRDRSVDQEHHRIAEALRLQSKRFVVVVDDIDRLNPDDALTIFRLVKSVGRLPNVIYLLAFDRQIAERIVTERFPSEGPSYLEKIVQRFFPLPPPSLDMLRQQLAEAAFATMGEPAPRQVQRFWNVFHDVVAPTLRTPRDVVRLASHVATGWPAIAGNVDRADFLAISALELAEPDFYGRIRSHPDELCGLRQRDGGSRQSDVGQEYNELMGLTNRSERDRRRLQIALRRLFPRLDSVWGNTWHGEQGWRRDRLIASRANFPTYFGFVVAEDVAAAETVERLVARADDHKFVTAEFRRALRSKMRSGTTGASLLLEELRYFASDVDARKVGAFVTTLFQLADTLDVDADRGRGFYAIGDNQLRIHWLLKELVQNRFDQTQRDAIYRKAMETASLSWSVDFARSCLADHAPQTEQSYRRAEPIVSEGVASDLRDLALVRIRLAARDGSLIESPGLKRLLFEWRQLNGGDANEVRAWSDEMLERDDFVLVLAGTLPSEGWSYGMGLDGMGDRVASLRVTVNLEAFSEVLDVLRLEARVDELLGGKPLDRSTKSRLEAFKKTPRETRRRREHEQEPDIGDEDPKP
ncbi:MAG: hypothetical protein KIT43_02230 [Bauldia sp.]|nr:hypothetical protein [Bauldia sp.]